MLIGGQQIELHIDKPAAGGRMIARHEGQVIFVLGAIPGERVRARIDRVERQLAFATALDVLEPSAERRAETRDLLCGGSLYSHIQYPRQLLIKAAVVADAFERLAHVHLDQPMVVAASPEHGYRLRARLHVSDSHAGFFREGTHTLCDARQTGQLTEATIDAVHAAVASLHSQGVEPSSVEVSENVAGNERVLSIEALQAAPRTAVLDRVVASANVSGCSLKTSRGRAYAGRPAVSDDLRLLTNGRAARGVLSRHAESFFQANRYLLADLVTAVLDSVLPAGGVLDLYAGVGLFSVALAATGRSPLVAVEGDHRSGRDLQRNAAQCDEAVRVVLGPVERFLETTAIARPATMIVDPPRTGLSRRASTRIAGLGARRIVYVSCDPATMARDARRLLDAGYTLRSLRAFDLFPNTPHVESVGVFDRD